MIDAMICIAPVQARGSASSLRDGSPVPRRVALSCRANAVEEDQTEGILQRQANIAAT